MKPSKVPQSKINEIEQMHNLFDKKQIEQLAYDTKFVQRKSKLTGVDFFFLCVFAHQQSHQISLEGLSNELLKDGKIVSKQSLQERFNDKAVTFMEKVMSEVLAQKLNVQAIGRHEVFKRIVIWDSTVFQLPAIHWKKYQGYGGGASKAAVKLQYCYDILSEAIVVMQVQQGIAGDNNQELGDIKKNDLRIEDLGYFKLERFKAIEKAGAFYLSRLRFTVIVYVRNKGAYEELNLLKLQRKMEPGERRTLEAFLGKDEKLAVRLVIERVPAALANEKRRKLKTDKHNKRNTLSQNRLKLCDSNVFITNTTEEQIPAERIRNYYSLRWQIEIIFKAWKSVYHIDKIKKMKLQRFECIHYGTLILIILTTHLMSYCKRTLYQHSKQQVSELKLFKTIKALIVELKQALFQPMICLLNFLALLEMMVLRTCIKEKKRNKLTPFDICLT